MIVSCNGMIVFILCITRGRLMLRNLDLFKAQRGVCVKKLWRTMIHVTLCDFAQIEGGGPL